MGVRGREGESRRGWDNASEGGQGRIIGKSRRRGWEKTLAREKTVEIVITPHFRQFLKELHSLRDRIPDTLLSSFVACSADAIKNNPDNPKNTGEQQNT